MAALGFAGPLPMASALEIVQAEAVFVEAGPVNQQLRAQFEPCVKVELSFAIRACKLEGEDRQKLIAAGEKWLNEYVKNMNKPQQNARGIRIFNGRVAQNANADPRDAIKKGIAETAKVVLSPEQLKLYEQECDQREQFHRQAIVAVLVSRMDEKLALSKEQQTKLTESLVEGWSDKWAPQLEIFMYNNDIWPPVPDKLVSPHLTADQEEVWIRIAKTAQNVHFGWNMNNGQQVIDDVEFEKKTEPQPPADAIFVPQDALNR